MERRQTSGRGFDSRHFHHIMVLGLDKVGLFHRLEGEMLYEDQNVRVWASDLDPKALLQAQMTARVPVVTLPVGLMPDAHVGLGATVGSVVPTEGAIMPSCVGVDIGCGVIGAKTNLTAFDLPDDLTPMLPKLKVVVPAGVGKGHDPNTRPLDIVHKVNAWLEAHHPRTELDERQQHTAWSQMGSLGSGNHFLEFSLDDEDNVWAVIHSGSRGIGNQLARLHIAKAKEQTKKGGYGLENDDLAWLVEGTPEFEHYREDLFWAQNYALANREIMMDGALKVLFDFVGKGQEQDRINCHHNYVAEETHYGKDVYVTRKGAISAQKGELGIIPGSMANGCYVTRGKGEALAYNTSSHGAGRRLSRGQAKRELDVESLNTAMKGRAWLADDAESLLDEHPEAYKDLEQVMADQADLTEPVTFLRAVLNFKGV